MMRKDNGQFAEGNPGKPKGATSGQNKEIRERFKMLLDNNMDKIQDDLNELKPRERIDAILNIANYVLPKLKSTDMQMEGKNVNVDFSEPLKIRRVIVHPDGTEEKY